MWVSHDLQQATVFPTHVHKISDSFARFFPGCIYALLERAVRFPQTVHVPEQVQPQLQKQLLRLGRHHGVAINQMSSRTDTHDMGFIVQPALQKDWELTGNEESLQSVVNAAYALASRYDDRVKAIRSWDVAINDRYSITDMSTNFLVIIDSMCSKCSIQFSSSLRDTHAAIDLDLLYFVGHARKDQTLIDIATQHADSIIHEILRPDFSSYHLVNFDPRTGRPQAKMTNQGWKDDSTWSRGQAWSIMGFAQVYTWTKNLKYLETAINCAQYFLRRLKEGENQWHHPMVPLWDFDAPQDDPAQPLRDVSAGVITANGLLIIHQSLQALPTTTAQHLAGSTDFLNLALQIVSQTLDMSYDADLACFAVPTVKPLVNGNSMNVETHPSTTVTVTAGVAATALPDLEIKESGFEALLRNSTTNWNEHAHKKYKDHGLVYADYYLLEFGNKLLRAGLV